MKPEIVSPVANCLLPDIKARRQPRLLRRVIGIQLRLLLQREAEEFTGNRLHVDHQSSRHPMVHDL